jgi:HSP20 family molecular chaperone IbpA
MNLTGKKHTGIKVLSVLLIFVCFGQAIFIYYLIKKEPEKFVNADEFSSFVNKKFKDDSKNLWENYDKFFDENFFRKQTDPFAAMEQFHKRMEEQMDEAFKNPFSSSWDSWLGNRFSGLDEKIDIDTKDNGNSYIITMNVPNLKDSKLNINIDEKGISMEGDVAKIVEKKDSKGNIVARNEMQQTISEKFPIPADADYKTAEVQKQKDKIVVTMQKTKPA